MLAISRDDARDAIASGGSQCSADDRSTACSTRFKSSCRSWLATASGSPGSSINSTSAIRVPVNTSLDLLRPWRERLRRSDPRHPSGNVPARQATRPSLAVMCLFGFQHAKYSSSCFSSTSITTNSQSKIGMGGLRRWFPIKTAVVNTTTISKTAKIAKTPRGPTGPIHGIHRRSHPRGWSSISHLSGRKRRRTSTGNPRHFLCERPKFSDGSQEGRRLQVRWTAAGPCSAWLGRRLFISLQSVNDSQ